MKKIYYINTVFWLLLCSAIMLASYIKWSGRGNYTICSFMCSIVFHGGFCLLGWMTSNDIIRASRHRKH